MEKRVFAFDLGKASIGFVSEKIMKLKPQILSLLIKTMRKLLQTEIEDVFIKLFCLTKNVRNILINCG